MRASWYIRRAQRVQVGARRKWVKFGFVCYTGAGAQLTGVAVRAAVPPIAATSALPWLLVGAACPPRTVACQWAPRAAGIAVGAGESRTTHHDTVGGSYQDVHQQQPPDR